MSPASSAKVLLELAPPRVARSRGSDHVEAVLDAEDVRWSFDRVTDRMVDLVLGRTTDNPSPAALGARVVEILDGMYRSAASGGSRPSAGADPCRGCARERQDRSLPARPEDHHGDQALSGLAGRTG